jgi:hypothetical protein
LVKIYILTTHIDTTYPLQLIIKFVEGRHGNVKTLALAGILDDLTELGASIKRVTSHDLPVVEHALREGLARSGGPKTKKKGVQV